MPSSSSDAGVRPVARLDAAGTATMIRLRTPRALVLLDSGGQELRAIVAQTKRIALLACLALAAPRCFHRRDTLIALFWPEHDTEHARNSLNQSVHALRRALGADAIRSPNSDALAADAR